MADGTGKYKEQTLDNFLGLYAGLEHKGGFPDQGSSYVKNFVMEDGSLVNRNGYLRVNATAYAGDIHFLIPYVNRDGTSYLFLGQA